MNHDLLRQVETLLAPCAAKYEVKSEHWIHGFDDDYDESESYCYDCAEKRIAELVKESPGNEYRIGGGYRSEGDSQAFCETCEAPLDNSFTTHAAHQELDHFEEHGLDLGNPCDCYSLLQVIAAEGCADSELNERIECMAVKVLEQIQPSASASALTTTVEQHGQD